jgi:hypothetical protein
MSDEPEHKTLTEIVGDQLSEFLPENLEEARKVAYRIGQVIGFAAGWIVVMNVIELLFPKGNDK